MNYIDNLEVLFNPDDWFKLLWNNPDSGYFGEISIQNNNGKLKIWTETMGKDFVKELLCKLVDDAELME